MVAGPAALDTRRGPGRPRDRDLDRQILQATLDLIDAGVDVTVIRVVERSGVSRAALYRRWPSLTGLIAEALDVGRDSPPAIRPDDDLREEVFRSLLGAVDQAADVPEERFRHRIRLAMTDRVLQRTYWMRHVSGRRAVTERALREGVQRGVLRPDLDVETCVDLMAGVFYYQFVVRGVGLGDAAARLRCRAALEVAWRGMSASA